MYYIILYTSSIYIIISIFSIHNNNSNIFKMNLKDENFSEKEKP